MWRAGYEPGLLHPQLEGKRVCRSASLVPEWQRVEGNLHLLAAAFVSIVLGTLLIVFDIRGRWIIRLLAQGTKVENCTNVLKF